MDWLALRQRAPAIHFFPDYDGVGLLNFARLRSRLGHSVAIVDARVAISSRERFGCTTLWQDTQREFNAMLAHPATADFDVEVEAIDRSMQASGCSAGAGSRVVVRNCRIRLACLLSVY